MDHRSILEIILLLCRHSALTALITLSSQSAFSQIDPRSLDLPEPPSWPTNMEQCQEYSRAMQEVLHRIEQSERDCLSTASMTPQADAGGCCLEWAGSAASMGWCRSAAACIGIKSQWYCLAVERKNNVRICQERVRGENGGDSNTGSEVQIIQREIATLSNKLDQLQQLASIPLKHDLARKLVEEAIHYTFSINGQALQEFEHAMRAYDQGQLSPTQTFEFQSGLLRQQIAIACAWSTSSAAMIQCVNSQLLINHVKTIRQ